MSSHLQHSLLSSFPIDAALLLVPQDFETEGQLRLGLSQQQQQPFEQMLPPQQLLHREQEQEDDGVSSLMFLTEALPIQSTSAVAKSKAKPKRPRPPRKVPKQGRWKTEEDARLLEIIPRLGTQSWVDIAKELVDAMKTHHGQDPKGPQRTCKQCRQRWTNFLDPTVRRAQWTKEEDDKILEMVKLYGHKWSDISRQLSGRSEALVKNRWYSTVSKVAGRIEDTHSIQDESSSSSLLTGSMGVEADGFAGTSYENYGTEGVVGEGVVHEEEEEVDEGEEEEEEEEEEERKDKDKGQKRQRR